MKKSINPTQGQLRMLASLKGNIWGIRPDHIEYFALSALESHEGSDFSDEDIYPMRKEAWMDGNGFAHIEVKGALLERSPARYEKLGLVTRYATIQTELAASIGAGALGVLLHIDSPGGTVAGNLETVEMIRDSPVPVVSHCSGLACSAAYKIACGTGYIAATKSSEVGNVGTILSWADCTGFWGEMGIEFKALVSEGADLKSTFHLEPDQTQLAFLQDRINEAGKQFRDFVAEGRAKAGAAIDPEVWRAGWYSGERAVSLGLIDDIGPAELALSALEDMQ